MAVQKRPLLILAALAAATEPDLGRSALDQLKTTMRDRYTGDPIGTTVSSVIVASWLFYRAERGHNPKVDSFVAALEYVTSSLSVGYTDIYPKTSSGKAIASALMTFGPAMAAGMFEDKSARKEAEAASESERQNDAVVERLDRILAALEARAVG